MFILSVFVAFLSLLNVGSYLLTGVVGFVYPAYSSFKALESEDKEDDRRCLVYWTVYAFCQLFDPVLSFCLSFVPAFYFFKLAFYVWMFLPSTKGAVVLYDHVFRPVLVKYQETIDHMIEDNIKKISDAYHEKVQDLTNKKEE